MSSKFCDVCNSFMGHEVAEDDAPKGLCNACNHKMNNCLFGCGFLVIFVVWILAYSMTT